MEDRKKKLLLYCLVAIAAIILTIIGGSFAYFSVTASSNNSAVNMTAATLTLDLEDDTSLIKQNIIPSAEEYVDIATTERVDVNGHFLKPYLDEGTGKTITEGTACIDDNNYEICSIYTFTIKNTMTTMDLPLYITLLPSTNSFMNLQFKVLDEDLNEVIGASSLGGLAPVVLANINTTLPRAIDDDTPTEVTYSIIMWVMEIGDDQTDDDAGKSFAATLNVKASGAEGRGISGTMNASGTE